MSESESQPLLSKAHKGNFLNSILTLLSSCFPGLKPLPEPTLSQETIHLLTLIFPETSASSSELSSWRLKKVLGRPLFCHLAATTQYEKIELLKLLAREAPNHIFCWPCRKLHTAHRTLHTGQVGHPYRKCLEEDRETQVYKYVYHNFSYPLFQMAMKRSLLGQKTNIQLKLLAQNNISQRRGFTYQCTAESRICYNVLRVRVQHIYVLPLANTQELRIPTDRSVAVCPHGGSVSTNSLKKEMLACILRCRLRHVKELQKVDQSCVRCAGLISCQKCPTEFQVDFKDFLQYGVAMVITKWQDLGEGQDREDTCWRSHLPGCKETLMRRPGAIRDAFEGTQKFDFEAFLPKIHKIQFKKIPLLLQKSPFPWQDDEGNTLPMKIEDHPRKLSLEGLVF